MNTNIIPQGTLNIETIKDAIQGWVFSVLPPAMRQSQIIWRNQTEPLPARPCVTLKIIDGPRPIARSGNIMPSANADGSFNVGMQQEMVLSVQVFGDTRTSKSVALQTIIDLNSSLIRPTILEALSAADISVQEVGQPRNLTELEESEYEERAGFEVTMGLVQNVKDGPGYIHTVNIGIDITKPDGTTAVDETKTVVLP